MKLIELKAENVKRLKAARVSFDGAMTVIGGKNGAGKSSVLDAIMYALAGASTLPGKPVRTGADKAEIEVSLEGQPNLVVRRKIKADGKTTLEIEQLNDDGSRAKIASPQKLLDSLVGSIAFDPLAFTRLRPQEQIEILRAAVGVSVDDIDAEIKRLFDERTAVNRDAKSLESQLAGMPQHKDAPAAEVAASEILAEIEAVNAHNADIEQQVRIAEKIAAKRDAALENLRAIDIKIDEVERQLASLEQQKESLANELEGAEAAVEMSSKSVVKLTLRDAMPLREKLATIESENAKVRANAAREAKADQFAAAQSQADDLSKQIEQLRTARVKRMDSAAWPVDGLGFGEAGVTFNGLPFEQCSSAEQLRISTAIALSQNPRLPIGFIRDGSLLDSESLALVEQLAAEKGAQIIVERVSDGDECSVIIEDGEVLAAAAVA